MFLVNDLSGFRKFMPCLVHIIENGIKNFYLSIKEYRLLRTQQKTIVSITVIRIMV